jgi:hypothetical protein
VIGKSQIVELDDGREYRVRIYRIADRTGQFWRYSFYIIRIDKIGTDCFRHELAIAPRTAVGGAPLPGNEYTPRSCI